MKINSETINDIVVVDVLADSLDAGNTREFRDAITPLIKGGSTLVLNLETVKFLDSSGCGSILSCLRQLNANGGDLKVCGLQKTVRSVFELVRIHRIIDIFDNRDEAIRQA
ncbi:anti-sigma factor antagonist [Desulfoluna limicola]|uniref:Anti-sigma factor antagonist n=1 Tax=Desulfoluna limicola TaxID=2810562 RepID=A0ABM7PC22_9BACT|nr:STAS domain-containing protein [Desulfoluna limicola]BCS95207.1 anti-sigma factor antagonist [Desulfoluna limicola]